MTQALNVNVEPGKNAGVTNYTGHTIMWFAFDFTNAKMVALVEEIYDWLGETVPAQPWNAATKQEVADKVLDRVVLYGWRRAHEDVNPPTPPAPIDFDSDNGA